MRSCRPWPLPVSENQDKFTKRGFRSEPVRRLKQSSMEPGPDGRSRIPGALPPALPATRIPATDSRSDFEVPHSPPRSPGDWLRRWEQTRDAIQTRPPVLSPESTKKRFSC